MDPRRAPRAVIDPKVRKVGFFAPPDPNPPHPPLFEFSPSANSLSPVMIPPPRHPSENILLHARPAVAISPSADESAAGSYSSSSEFFPAPMSPSQSSCSTELVFDAAALLSPGGGGSGGKAAASFPRGGFDLTETKASKLTTASVVNAASVRVHEKEEADQGGGSAVEVKNQAMNSKQKKEKTSKAERRALQEAQRAAKAAAKAEGSKASRTVTSANVKPAKASKPPQKVDNASVAVSEKKGGERPPEKDRKKDVPQPRMQYDDKSRVDKAKRRAVVKHTEARNRVELFRHLPQYEHGSQLPDLEAKFFHLDPVHPSVYKVGLQYLSGAISGGNARCIAMLQAFEEAIKDYKVPPEKNLVRDLTAKISSYVSFLIECRPLSISMGNAIRFLKNRIAKLPLTLSESESKTSLQSDIERFINEKIILADKVIVKHAVTKIRDGDVLLTYGSSSAVEMILLNAHELGKQFRVVVVDSRPKLRGKLLLQGCLFGVGTACVAMVAHAFHVPVIVCCEAYKFHERVQLDSICSNELGDPDVISKVWGREDVYHLDGWANTQNLQLINLIYDATPSDYVSMIITDYGMVPPTSIPVIVREYSREQVWI